MDKWVSRSTLEVLSKVISVFTIVTCTFLKVPQIYTVVTMESAQGLMFQAILLEVISVTLAYNYVQGYSVLTYMEYPIVLSGDLLLLYFVLKYKGLLSHPVVMPLTVLYWVLMYCFSFEVIPKYYLFILVQICTPMATIAKVTHIYAMVSQKSAEAVSLTTWVITFLSNATRIFTVALDSGDLTLIINFFGAGTLSLGVLFTAIYFQTMVEPKSVVPLTPRYSITMMYNYVNQYSLITYLEYPIILAGNMALLYYVLKYKNMLQTPIVPGLTILYCVIMYCLAVELIPKIFLFVVIQGCTPMSAMAKITHIYAMVSQESAETVSLTTWTISFLSNITRIFTVYLDSADTTLLLNFLISGFLSLCVLLTAIFYQSAKRIKDKEMKDK